MDIAEIRKKAKVQAGSPDGAAPEERLQVDSPREEKGVHVDDGAADCREPVSPDAAEPGFVLEDALSALPEAEAGLDQLFAVTDGLALATDESYADLLSGQAEDEDLASNQYLAFHLGDEEYALDIRQISEIIKVREFTDIPRAPDFILGIISLRGVVVPVYDLQRRLNLGTSDLLHTSRIVVCQHADVSVGLLVDSINQVVKLAENDLEPPPGVLSGLDRDMVVGIGRFQGRMVILLNLQSVLEIEI